jgi:hypothetical protein
MISFTHRNNANKEMTMTAPLMTANDFDQIHELITKSMECSVNCDLGVREDKDRVSTTHDTRRFREDADDIDAYAFDDLKEHTNTIAVLNLTRTTGLRLDVYVYDATEGWAIDTVNPEWNGTDWTL